MHVKIATDQKMITKRITAPFFFIQHFRFTNNFVGSAAVCFSSFSPHDL